MACIWGTNLLIGDDGRLLNRHRKLVPTYWEKMTRANGDGSGLRVVDTRIGKLAALVCGENTHSLARFALLAQGENVHVSSISPRWPGATRARHHPDKACGIHPARLIRGNVHRTVKRTFTLIPSSAPGNRRRQKQVVGLRAPCGRSERFLNTWQVHPPRVTVIWLLLGAPAGTNPPACSPAIRMHVPFWNASRNAASLEFRNLAGQPLSPPSSL
ncbi:hypothetical protein BZL54_04395 [Burkholderia ubonensis subsp. mesacidophila]|uniref:CN hydrolase domain-containing protein n=1 Tax=Burkholderia ubonensis subsp. mesacidophila TaxID=265293 RepID=A0A2A4FLD9_9BURK|nr:hypothetical protein BZL54_04395 [Burkholderia ubonensis subsp. mesacidophila]